MTRKFLGEVRAAASALAGGLLLQAAAFAAEEGTELKDVVVTATRTAKVVSEAPASVTVVTAREIDRRDAQRVDEALAGAPGVFTRGLGAEQPSNYQNQITLRGIPGYYRTGILVDGVPINNAFSGGVNMSIVPVDDIKQIEVVPGPFSSLYGGAGMAGVINIITRAPDKREFLVKGEGGSHDFKSIDLGYRDRLSERFGISLSYGHKESDGYSGEYVTKTPTGSGGTPVYGWQQTRTTTGAATYIVGDKGPEAWRQDNVGGKLLVQLAPDSRLILESSFLTTRTLAGYGNDYLFTAAGTPFASGSANIDGRSATVRATDFLRPTNGEDVTRHVASYETRIGGDYRLKANLAYQDNQYWYTSITANATNTSGPGSYSDIPAKRIDGDVQLGFPVAGNQYLLVGAAFGSSALHKRVYALADWRRKDDRGALGDWSDGHSRSAAAYVQDEISLTDRLTAYLGARYDRWSTDGTIYVNGVLNHYAGRSSSAVNPKASVVYAMESGTVVKAAIGKAFRAPNLSDMYSSFGSGSTIYWSNPGLDPEKVTTAEIGVEREFAGGTMLRGTVYRSDITDLMYLSTSGANRYRFNAGAARTEGVDLEARQRVFGGLTAFVNGTLVRTLITENSIRPSSVGKQIPLQPKKMANIGIEGARGPWSGSLIGTYVGRIFGTDDNTDVVQGVPGSYDPYFVVSAKVAYRIAPTLTGFVALKNLADRDYYVNSVKADGRTVYVGLGFKY